MHLLASDATLCLNLKINIHTLPGNRDSGHSWSVIEIRPETLEQLATPCLSAWLWAVTQEHLKALGKKPQRHEVRYLKPTAAFSLLCRPHFSVLPFPPSGADYFVGKERAGHAAWIRLSENTAFFLSFKLCSCLWGPGYFTWYMNNSNYVCLWLPQTKPEKLDPEKTAYFPLVVPPLSLLG